MGNVRYHIKVSMRYFQLFLCFIVQLSILVGGNRIVTDPHPWPHAFGGDPQRTSFAKPYDILPTENIKDPYVKWKKVFSSKIESSPTLSRDGSVGYVGVLSNSLVAFETSGGYILWNFKADGPISGSPLLSTNSNTVYIGCQKGNLYALNTKTGSLEPAVAPAGRKTFKYKQSS